MLRNETSVPNRNRRRNGEVLHSRGFPRGSPLALNVGAAEAARTNPKHAMRIRHIPTLLGTALCAWAAASCDNPAEPKQVPGSELVFIRADDDAPPLDSMVVHVWAKAGENRQAVIRYVKVGSYGGDICLEFKIPGNGLWKRPDGSVVAKGDSVLITITVVDPKQFNFRFEPSGVQFRPDHPAELRVSYKWANPADLTSVSHFGIWKQESVSDPWVPIGTVRDSNLKELRANITGFTRYAMAGN